MWWRDRTIRVLAILMLAVFFVAWGARTDGFGLRPLGHVCSLLFSPVDWLFSGVTGTVKKVRGTLASNVRLMRENSELRRQLDEAQLIITELEELRRENRRLSRLLNLPVPPGYTRTSARVVGRSVTNLYQTLRINAGVESQIRPGAPVVSGHGLVGQVLDASLFSATVLLITDANSGVAVVSAQHRSNGVTKGTGEEYLLMDYVAGSDLLEPGEEVVTSGLGGVFPKGLPVGVITSVTPDPVTHVKTATVLPYTDFSKLEEVSVLLPVTVGGEPAE